MKKQWKIRQNRKEKVKPAKKEKEEQRKRQKEVERLDKIYDSLDRLKERGVKREIEKRFPALERLKNKKENCLN